MDNKTDKKQDGYGFWDKVRDFLKNRGLYVVLMACLVLVGLAAALAWGRDGNEQKAQQSVGVASSQDEALKNAAQHSAKPTPVQTPAIPTPSPEPAQTLMPDFTQAPVEAAETEKPEKASGPVKGEVSWGYAVNELVYSNTLKQWMTHCGVDVAVPKGTEVYAVYNGTVERVYTDDALGVTVVLSHSEGRRTVYANLKEEPPVKEGQTLRAHELIGYVGDTAVAECADGSHLHFELYAGEKPVDPAEYILFHKELGD